MALELSLLGLDDFDEFVEVDDLAMRDFPFAQAMASNLPPGLTRKELIRGFMRTALTKSDAKKPWFVVKDTKLDKIIAGGNWEFFTHGPMLDSEAKEDKEQSGNLLERSRYQQNKFVDTFVGTRPYANLAVVFTHPDHRRRGAAGMIVQHGCEIADDARMMCTVNASLKGLPLYLRHGFVVVQESELDLSPWGVNETHIGTGMVREAKWRDTVS